MMFLSPDMKPFWFLNQNSQDSLLKWGRLRNSLFWPPVFHSSLMLILKSSFSGHGDRQPLKVSCTGQAMTKLLMFDLVLWHLLHQLACASFSKLNHGSGKPMSNICHFFAVPLHHNCTAARKREWCASPWPVGWGHSCDWAHRNDLFASSLKWAQKKRDLLAMPCPQQLLQHSIITFFACIWKSFFTLKASAS